MIRRCRNCGICAGGLVSSHYVPYEMNWPESDLCPQCAAIVGPLPESDSDIAIRSMIKQARKLVAPQIETERAGEHVGQGLMEFVLR